MSGFCESPDAVQRLKMHSDASVAFSVATRVIFSMGALNPPVNSGWILLWTIGDFMAVGFELVSALVSATIVNVGCEQCMSNRRYTLMLIRNTNSI